MQTTFSIRHEADMPWCCFDQETERLVIRLAASREVSGVSILYSDPYEWERGKGILKWPYTEQALRPQYSGADTVIWRAEMGKPRWNRLKYSFRVQTPDAAYCFTSKGLLPLEERALDQHWNHFFYPYIHGIDAPHTPAWARNTVWYQIFPERFHNGDPALSPPNTGDWERGEPAPRNFFGGDLRGIRQKLGYLKELEISGIYLTPVFQAPSNHKYDTEDYYAVDSHFGSLEDLKALVADAHRLGMRVMLDAVFNHAGKTHPFWQDVLEKQERSAYRDCFHIRGFPVKEPYEDCRNMNFEAFAFSASMPKWNTEHPQAREYLIGAALYWIRECDIDAWRLDVANEVSFDFWREFSRRVHGVKRDFYVLGEVWYDAGRWVNPGYFDAVMNYPLGFALIDFFLKKKTGPDEFTSRLYGALSRYSDVHARAAFNLLDSHDTERALTAAGGDKLALRSAFTMLFLLPGSPCIYYGTEIGMDGGGDPQNRRPMIWDEKRQDRELFVFFQRLIALRQEYAAVISEAVIAYRKLGDADCWTLGAEGTLSIVYTGEKSFPSDAGRTPGRLVFSAACGDSPPPHSVAVYAGGVQEPSP